MIWRATWCSGVIIDAVGVVEVISMNSAGLLVVETVGASGAIEIVSGTL
jgi:hypothetical protein